MLLLALWFGGEVFGFIIAGVATGAFDGGDDFPVMAYLGALAGAVVGAVVAFAIVGSLSSVKQHDDFDDEDFDAYDRSRDHGEGQDRKRNREWD